MKKIGLVGGTGPESTQMYYKELNSRIDRLTGGKAMPDIVIDSVDFRRAWRYVVDERYDLLTDYLSEKTENLRKCGAEVISLTAVTMHVVSDDITAKTGADLVSIPKAVCKEAQSKGYKTVGLLGTIFTMEKDYMKKDFREAGINVAVPCKEDRDLVAKRIYEELELGIVKESTLKEFQEIITKMKHEEGIEAVILGCTELPLLLNSGNCPVPCLDSVEIHINELISQAFEE
ncbi:aspartate/glutamate racemase family protein [Butyrivibrio sp. AE2032]|uniref:aspartate/glutamate racemase family protein n=1 Tax=Butyrivibrio sp. AE2032 TaxID=1458463 RepID=UPI00054E24DE|nr:amino acid racemase [Butyrivibrio sp. AE2032]